MFIVLLEGEIDDPDMEQLNELLNAVDHQFTINIKKRKETHVPEQNIYWDRLSYITGLGFVMCQQYINITYPSIKINKKQALLAPPMHSSGYSVAQLINAGANYWKHYQEEIDPPYGSLHQSTVKLLEKIGITIEYPYLCEDLLDRIVETEISPFKKLSELLLEWRNNLIEIANKSLENRRA